MDAIFLLVAVGLWAAMAGLAWGLQKLKKADGGRP